MKYQYDRTHVFYHCDSSPSSSQALEKTKSSKQKTKLDKSYPFIMLNFAPSTRICLIVVILKLNRKGNHSIVAECIGTVGKSVDKEYDPKSNGY